MSSDSDQNDEGDMWVFYCDRPEWSDIKPLPQNDLSVGIVAIAYSKKCNSDKYFFKYIYILPSNLYICCKLVLYYVHSIYCVTRCLT